MLENTARRPSVKAAETPDSSPVRKPPAFGLAAGSPAQLQQSPSQAAPLHGRITQDPHVLPQDRSKVDLLIRTLEGLVPRLHGALARPPRGFEILRGNAYAADALQLLVRYLADLKSGSLRIRFSSRLGGAFARGEYDFESTTLTVPDFTSAAEVQLLIPTMLHEYDHAAYDRQVIAQLGQSSTPIRHTATDEVDMEMNAWRSGSYIALLLNALGPQPNLPLAMGNAVFEADYRSRFEAERTATGTAQEAAHASLSEHVRSQYADQVQDNAALGRFRAELNGQNHVVLQGHGRPRDLGQVPAQLTAASGIAQWVQGRVNALPDRATLFQAPGGAPYTTIEVSIYSQGSFVGRTTVMTAAEERRRATVRAARAQNPQF